MILLDTNVVSEAFRVQPSANVQEWYNRQRLDQLFLCTPVLAELRYGLERLPAGVQRDRLEQLIGHIETDIFPDRILNVDRDAAHQYGRILAHRSRIGRPMMTMDALIAAVAASHGAALATRDIADFGEIDLDLIDPFAPGSS
jgi:predicted nucleic acid-binding protein